MPFLLGPLEAYFVPSREPRLLKDPHEIRRLVVETNCLIALALTTTKFAPGALGLGFLHSERVHTIFKRSGQRGEPYALSDLASDIRSGVVDRDAIAHDVEARIRQYARPVTRFPEGPRPVIIESSCATGYLILEANKRLAGLCLGIQGADLSCEAVVGKSEWAWPDLLGAFDLGIAD